MGKMWLIHYITSYLKLIPGFILFKDERQAEGMAQVVACEGLISNPIPDLKKKGQTTEYV
jgi:hypothetical protein